jgi:beta-galactosidase
VNRHEHDGFTGKAMSYAAMLRDAALMKTLHFNAVRCSHYPNHSGWYRLCDEVVHDGVLECLPTD